MAIDYNAIVQNATNAYNSAVSGFKAQLASQQQQQQGVVQGYNALQAGVLGGLEQSSAVAGKQISNQYAQQGAQQQMQLIRQGLGNFTTRNNLQNQLASQAAFAQNDRMAKYATLAADKTTQLGMAGLNYAGHAIDANAQFAGQGLQYAGQGALGVGNLAQGFAGLENQKAMQDAAFAQQIKMQRLNQLYGAGGGGHIGSFDHPSSGQGGAIRDSQTAYGGRGGGDNPYYNQQFPYSATSLTPASSAGYSGGGWQPWTGEEDLTGFTLNGRTINNDQVAYGEGDWSPFGYQGEDLSA